jgi:hypothetical protein
VVVVVETVEEAGAEEGEEGEEEGGATAEITQKCISSKGQEISFLPPFESNAGDVFIWVFLASLVLAFLYPARCVTDECTRNAQKLIQIGCLTACTS